MYAAVRSGDRQQRLAESLAEQPAGGHRERAVGDLEAATEGVVDVLVVGVQPVLDARVDVGMCVPRYQAPPAKASTPTSTNEIRSVATYRIASRPP